MNRHVPAKWNLIPLSLGGSNRQKNLWPQSGITEPWNSHVKDRLLVAEVNRLDADGFHALHEENGREAPARNFI